MIKPKANSSLRAFVYVYGLAIDEEKQYPLLQLGLAIFQGLAPFINIIGLRYIINELTGKMRVDVLIQYVAFCLGLNLLTGLFSALLTHASDNCHKKFNQMFDLRLSEKATKMDYRFVESADFHSRAEKARTSIFEYSGGLSQISGYIRELLASMITVVASANIILSLSPWLVFIMILVVMLNSFISAKSNRKDVIYRGLMTELTRKFGYYRRICQVQNNAKDVRLYKASDMIIRRVNEYREEYERNDLVRRSSIDFFNTITTVISSILLTLIYSMLGFFAITEGLALGDFQMLVSSTTQFSSGLSGISLGFVRLRRSADYLLAYKDFMELESHMTYGSEEIPSGRDRSIEFRNVSFRYPGSEVCSLKGINLLIRAGEKVSIVGENGAGKTTLVKLLTRLYDPDKGEILVDGVNIRELSQRSLNSLFSVVFQDYRMLPLTISEAVAISTNYDAGKLKSALERTGFSSTLESLPIGLNTILGKSLDEEGVELSGGQLQRLAIARALYKDADIAILDEPTAALDPQMELEVYERFNNLIGNKTTLFISHRLASCRFCDRIAVFSKGEIVELGNHDELLDRGGLYARMWEAQAGYYRAGINKSVEDHGKAE